MGNPVTWFEINSSNPSSLHEFYSRAFGWKMQPVAGMDSAMVDTDSAAGIAGSIGKADGPNQVTFYIEADDLQSHLDRVESLGGKTVVPVTEIPDIVTFAQFADPDGNVVGLFQSSS
jgi:predicted enzyme related to lactoylglutathione lyase